MPMSSAYVSDRYSSPTGRQGATDYTSSSSRRKTYSSYSETPRSSDASSSWSSSRLSSQPSTYQSSTSTQPSYSRSSLTTSAGPDSSRLSTQTSSYKSSTQPSYSRSSLTTSTGYDSSRSSTQTSNYRSSASTEPSYSHSPLATSAGHDSTQLSEDLEYDLIRMRGKVDSIGASVQAQEAPDDRYYVKCMKEILEAIPNKGPPPHAVKLSGHIYIGNMRNADDVVDLKRQGITHVLNMAGTRRFDETRSPYPPKSSVIAYLMIPAEDHDQYDIMQHFSKCISFLDKCKKSGGKALVHCNLGVNRSGAVAAAYLMVNEHKTLLEVVALLKRKRSVVLCNRNFRRQLIRFARVRGLLDPIITSSFSSFLDNDKVKPSKQDTAPSRDSSNGHSSSLPRYGSAYSNSYRSNSSSNKPTDSTSSTSSTSSTTSSRTRTIDYTPKSYSLPRKVSSSSLAPAGGSKPKYSGKHDMEAVPEEDSVSSRSSSFASRWFNKGSKSPASRYDRSSSTTTTTSSSIPPSPAYSPMPSPKSGFLSKFGRSRNKSCSNVSTISEDSTLDTSSNASRRLHGVTEEEDVALSTQRPLRVYKRASTDTELYRRPTAHTYRRAETIATSEPDHDMHARVTTDLDDPLLPQEELYHSARAHAYFLTRPHTAPANTNNNPSSRPSPTDNPSSLLSRFASSRKSSIERY